MNPWLLTPEQYEALKERVRKAKNGKGPQGGIFNPTVLNGDAISMPGNQGGSNWGTAAANPQRGLVFVTNVNQVALLRLNDVKDPPAAQGRGGGGGVQVDAGVFNEGRRAYTVLHGVSRGRSARRYSRRAVARRRHGPHRRRERARDRLGRPQQHAADPRCIQRRDSRDLLVL